MAKIETYLTSKQWIVRLYRRLAVLQVVSYVANCVCLIVDSAVTGSLLGSEAMAAFGLAAPICTLCFAIALIAGCGTNILCINESVSGDKDRVRDRFVLSLLASLLIAVVLMAVLFFGSGSILKLVSGKEADAALTGAAAEYLKFYALGLPAIVLNMIFSSTFQMDGEKALLVVATVVLTVADVVLDLMAVLVFRSGLKGIALASTISAYLQLLILMIHFVKPKKLFKLRLKHPEFKTAFAFVKVGFPMGLQLALMAAMTVFANSILLNRFGTDAVSVMGMIFSCGALFRVTGDAAGASFVPVATLCDGEKNRALLRQGFSYAQKWNFIVGICISVVEFILAAPIAKFFFAEPELQSMATTALRIFSLSIGLYGASYLVQSTYLAIGNIEKSIECSVLSDFAVPLLCILAQSSLFGLNGFWMTFITGKAFVLLIYFAYASAKRDKKEKFILADLVVIPEDRYHIVETLSSEIRTAEDVTCVSEEIRAKMLSHDAAPRMANALSLAVEEIAAFVVRYGIKANRNVYVNIYMHYDGACWTVRIRDNCSTGNPLECLVTDETVDEFSKIGIKMVSRMLKDVNYIRTVETNNIVMRIGDGV